MREKIIEQKLCKAVKDRGGLALKFTSPGYDGMPDRMILFPEGRICFIEVKAPGKKPRALQTVRHEMLRSFGFKVLVLDDESKIAEVFNEI